MKKDCSYYSDGRIKSALKALDIYLKIKKEKESEKKEKVLTK
ncbi:MAG: hypothetical protein ACOXZR_04965 [Bacilli bacterium]|jgi:hypothetical protein